jgi:hypothetical protein
MAAGYGAASGASKGGFRAGGEGGVGRARLAYLSAVGFPTFPHPLAGRLRGSEGF